MNKQTLELNIILRFDNNIILSKDQFQPTVSCSVVVDSLFIVAPVVCVGFMFGSCFAK